MTNSQSRLPSCDLMAIVEHLPTFTRQESTTRCLFVFAGFRSKEDKNSESYFANTLQLRGFLPQKKFRRNEKSKRQHCSKDDLGTSWLVSPKKTAATKVFQNQSKGQFKQGLMWQTRSETYHLHVTMVDITDFQENWGWFKV